MNRLLKASGMLIVGSTSLFCTTQTQNPYPFVYTLQYRANNPIQDRLSYFKLNSIKGYCVSVFDGHGGDLVAQYAHHSISQFLNQRIQINKSQGLGEKQLCEKSLNEAYDDIQNNFFRIFKQNIDMKAFRTVGACALTAIILQKSVYIANSGDCEGILSGKDFKMTNQRLNAGQHEQQQRLSKLFPNQKDIYKCKKGTNYCYVKGRLQPTRSLGDYYLKYPEFNFTNLKIFTGPYIDHRPVLTNFKASQFKYLALATDGLWDQISGEDAHNVLNQKLENPAEGLFRKAMDRIQRRTQMSAEKLSSIDYRRDLHDDITIVVVDLQQLRKNL